jgi:hypothetical protein
VKRGTRVAIWLALFVAVAVAPARALAINFSIGGSGALDARVFIGAHTQKVAQPSSIGIDTLSLELAQKLIVDVTKNVNVNVKVCYGCHSVEVDQAYAEVQLRDWFSLRAGRINVPLGEFNVRHDPANYTTPSKPLPFAMGDMLYYRPNEFNLGVVPTPYSDNGAELFGSFWIGHKALFDYAAYVVRGFVGTNDLNWVDSRQWIANKQAPAVGGRAVLSVGPLSIGGSVSWGYYDPNQRLTYLIYGGELFAHWRSLVLRAEFIARQTDYDRNAGPYLFAQAPPYYFVKAGYYAQLDWTPLEWLTLIGRIDGLFRLGMPLPNTVITEDATEILRGTVAVAVRFAAVLMIKADYEYWSFFNVPFENQHVVRAQLVFTY